MAFGDTITTEYRLAAIDGEKRRTYADVACANHRGELVASGRHIRAFVD